MARVSNATKIGRDHDVTKSIIAVRRRVGNREKVRNRERESQRKRDRGKEGAPTVPKGWARGNAVAGSGARGWATKLTFGSGGNEEQRKEGTEEERGTSRGRGRAARARGRWGG